MKKVLFFAAAALTMLAACNKTEVVYDNDPQEIAFVSVSDVATKTPVPNTEFLGDDDMAIAAYIVEGTTPANYFGYTWFTKKANSIWSGQPARYWPLTTSKINFLAVTEKGGKVDKTTVSFDATTYAAGATAELIGNNVLDQNDLMFAAGTGTHTQGGEYSAVPMVFKHALSWINFKVKTETPAYNATTKTGCTIIVNKITLNSAVFDGKLTLTNAQCTSTDINDTKNVIANWEKAAPTNLEVPNADGTGTPDAITLNQTYQLFGNGLLVVPDGYAGSFTINYTLVQSDNTANTYDYTYNLPAGSWEMAKKYFYNINITLSEIEVTPSVIAWEPQTAVEVPLTK